jgi:hypothetical protein
MPRPRSRQRPITTNTTPFGPPTPGQLQLRGGRRLLGIIRTHIHYDRVYTPVGSYRPNGDEYEVYMTYPNSTRAAKSVRLIFYYVRVTYNTFVATEVARSELTFGEGFGGGLFVMWMRHYGLMNRGIDHTSIGAQDLFTDTVFLD